MTHTKSISYCKNSVIKQKRVKLANYCALLLEVGLIPTTE